MNKSADWISHRDIRSLLESESIQQPWFTAYGHTKGRDIDTTWFSALVPLQQFPNLLKVEGWDYKLQEGKPIFESSYKNGEISQNKYYPFGNRNGIEPLVIYREFNGIRDDCREVAQEFCLYYNLFHDHNRQCFLHFDDNGDETEAVRYTDSQLEIRADLVLKFCAVKRMALAVYVDSLRFSSKTLKELGLKETRAQFCKNKYNYHLAYFKSSETLNEEFKTSGHIMGKKYIIPGSILSDEDEEETFQKFIIETNAQGKTIKSTCNPDKLGNLFGANPRAPQYLTPVYFRPEVLTKYYAEPSKYSVEDGYLRCGCLWGMRIDNDQTEYVSAWLGDLGRDLSESERSYWLSFNIPPYDKKISRTNFMRSFMAVATDPKRPDLIFKQRYEQFCHDFKALYNWDFFLPLHKDDEHFFIGLHMLSKDNQTEFDNQLLALTKVVIDSINEKELTKGLKSISASDKGISKIEKYFKEKSFTRFESHVQFLRILQELRSTSAAHRKGSSYEKLVADLQIADEGQKQVLPLCLNVVVTLSFS